MRLSAVALWKPSPALISAITIKATPKKAMNPAPMLTAPIVHTTPTSATITLTAPLIMDLPRPGLMLFMLTISFRR